MTKDTDLVATEITTDTAIERLMVHLSENPDSLRVVWELCMGDELILIDKINGDY